jgi:hypothetical protein
MWGDGVQPSHYVEPVRATLRWLILLALVAACDCDSPPETPQAPDPPAEHTALERGEPLELELEAPPPPEPTPPTEAELDRMGEGEVEALCFDGDRRACDRLGH